MCNLHVTKKWEPKFLDFSYWNSLLIMGSDSYVTELVLILRSLLLLISKEKAGICFLNVLSVLLSHCSEGLQIQNQKKLVIRICQIL